MPTLQQQILDRFEQCDSDVREVITSVIQFEIENIHLDKPRYKAPILDILERIARTASKEQTDEA